MAFRAAIAPLYRPVRRMVSAVRHLASPYQRYQHAQGLHAIRVALAMLTTILITSGLHMPHGDWASVSMLIVIGGIQHHGNIRKKAAERAMGTLVGAVCGLCLIVLHAIVGSDALTYSLLALSAGICAFYAIGRAGYIALLTAITIIIVAGHGDNSLETGAWRAANVFVGIVVALVFSFALPLHASYAWRYGFALNLRRCAALMGKLLSGTPITPDARNAILVELTRRSIKLRGLLPSVAKEMDVPLPRLEEIQDLHRSFLGALEMMSAAATGRFDGPQGDIVLRAFHAEGQYMRAELLGIARVLRADPELPVTLYTSDELMAARPHAELASLPAELQGSYWLVHRMLGQIDQLRQLLTPIKRARGRR